MKMSIGRTQTINNTKIKYIKIGDTDKLYEVQKISFYDFSIKAVETDLKIADIAENEVFPIEELSGDFRIRLVNVRSMGELIDYAEWMKRNRRDNFR